MSKDAWDRVAAIQGVYVGELKLTEAPEVLSLLEQELIKAAAAFEAVGDSGKVATYNALVCVAQALVRLGFSSAALKPIMNAYEAVRQSQEGISNPTFSVSKVPYRSKLSAAALRERGALAAMTEYCVRHHKADGVKAYRDAGGRTAARLLRESKYIASKKYTGRQLLSIRDAVGEVEKDSGSGRAYQAALKFGLGVTPLQAAEDILKFNWGAAP